MLSDVTNVTSLETPAQESSTQENPIPELVSAVTSVAEMAKVISSLHQNCDWLLQNFDTRKTARAGEVEALNNTKGSSGWIGRLIALQSRAIVTTGMSEKLMSEEVDEITQQTCSRSRPNRKHD